LKAVPQPPLTLELGDSWRRKCASASSGPRSRQAGTEVRPRECLDRNGKHSPSAAFRSWIWAWGFPRRP